jgi:conjugative transfer pilus assembly protein TraH
MKFKRLIIAIALTAPLAVPAGIMGDMNAMFMSNSTASGKITTRDRVGVFGGGFSMRAPIKSVAVVAFDPPRLSAGCGGFDLYGGSFTFLNGQQLVDIFRKVAANAAGLAFKAAIKMINPGLDQLMGEFQSLLQNMNNLGKNSCQMAHLIVDPAERAVKNALEEGGVGAVQKSMFTDASSALQGYLSDANAYFKKSGEVNAKAGNVVMKAITASGAANILGMAGLGNPDGSSDDASDPNSLNNRILLSFLGYEINGVPCKSFNQDGQQDTSSVASNNNLGKIVCKSSATLKMDDMIKGGGAGSIRETAPLTLFKCVDPNGSGTPNGGFDPQICTQVKKENFNYAGIQGYVNTMLFGSPTVDPVSPTSIVGSFNTNASTKLTSAQYQFIAQSGLPVIQLLTKTTNPNTRIAIAQKLGVYLSDCIGARLGESLYKSANSIEYGHSHEISKDVKANIEILRQDYMELQKTCVRDSAVLKIAQELSISASLNSNTK